MSAPPGQEAARVYKGVIGPPLPGKLKTRPCAGFFLPAIHSFGVPSAHGDSCAHVNLSMSTEPEQYQEADMNQTEQFKFKEQKTFY
jgi:hypothetical protein